MVFQRWWESGKRRARRAGQRSRQTRDLFATEQLEPRQMMATSATLSPDLSRLTRVPVTFLRPDGSVAMSRSILIGQLNWSGANGDAVSAGLPNAFGAYCIDGAQPVSPGKTMSFSGFDMGVAAAPLGGAPLIGPARADLFRDFWRQFGPATSAGFTDGTDAAAFQLATWEIINDATRSGTKLSADLTSGSFSVGAAGRTLPAFVRAQQWLAAFDTTLPATRSIDIVTLTSAIHQDQAAAVSVVDLDVDSDNSGSVVRSNFEESIEDDPTRPGVIVPVGGGQTQMIVAVPAGRTATLAFDAAAARKVRVSPATGMQVLPNGTRVIPVSGGSPQPFWIEAFAPSSSMADIVFTLTSAGTGPASSDVILATAVAVDLDVDSNNDGKIDPENAATGSDDPIEPDQSRGLVVPVYAGDSDRDGVDDTVDFTGIAGRRFAPVKVGLSEGAALAWQWPTRSVGSPDEDLPGLTFTFSFSDAGFGSATGGMFRLWKKDAPDVRNVADLIRTGVPIRASELLTGQPFTTLEEYLRNHGTTTLYLEAVSPSAAYEPIEVSIGGTGAWANSTTIDRVHARALETTFDLGVDSNNNEGFGVPKRSPLAEKQWEEKLENNAYALGKLVMQTSSTQIGDTIAEDRLAASFTPVVVELPRNLPIDARTIGVKFAMDAIGALNSGEIQLWNHNKGPGLLQQDAAGQQHPIFQSIFGHRVYFNKPYTLSQINYDPATGQAMLYMDGHDATKSVKLNDVEQGVRLPGILHATLTFDAPNARLSLAEDSVQYMVVRDDFFYHDLQFGSVGLRSTGSQVRSALASRGVYSYADLPNFALKRLTTRKDPKSPPGELQDILELDPNSDAVALLYNDADKPGTPTAYPGFKAVLYQDYAAVADNTFVLTFGGTDDQLGLAFNGEMPELADWVENVGQGLGWRIAQYRWAMQVARAVYAAVEPIRGGATLTTTGHSLGGGLASAASAVTGATGVTFNAAGLHENSLRMYFENDPAELAVALARYQNPKGLVTAYTVDWDFLSNFQDRLRLVVNTALGDRRNLDGPHDFAIETIKAINAAFNAAGAVPGGALVKLGINLAAKAGTGYLMYRCHSMDAVLYGLLVEEHRLSANRDLLGYPLSRFC